MSTGNIDENIMIHWGFEPARVYDLGEPVKFEKVEPALPEFKLLGFQFVCRLACALPQIHADTFNALYYSSSILN